MHFRLNLLFILLNTEKDLILNPLKDDKLYYSFRNMHLKKVDKINAHKSLVF